MIATALRAEGRKQGLLEQHEYEGEKHALNSSYHHSNDKYRGNNKPPSSSLEKPSLPAERPKKNGRPSLCEVIGAGKSISTVLYIRGVRNLGRDPFLRKSWQRMYTESDVRRIRRYIEENPIHHVQHLT